MEFLTANQILQALISAIILAIIAMIPVIIWLKIIAWQVTLTVLKTIDNYNSNGNKRLKEWQNKFK